MFWGNPKHAVWLPPWRITKKALQWITKDCRCKTHDAVPIIYFSIPTNKISLNAVTYQIRYLCPETHPYLGNTKLPLSPAIGPPRKGELAIGAGVDLCMCNQHIN